MMISYFRRCLASDINKDDMTYAPQITPFEPDYTEMSVNLRFYLKLNVSFAHDTTLSVVQIDPYKESSVLQLQMTQGTPEMTNSYLGSRLSLNVRQLAECKEMAEELKKELSITTQMKESAKEELKELR